MADASIDSTIGKVMQKVGSVLHNPGLVAKGQAKREGADAEARKDEKLSPAN